MHMALRAMLEVRGTGLAHPFEHPAASEMLERLGRLLSNGKALVERDHFLIFVCGGPKADPDNVRPRFLQYVDCNFPGVRPFLAEAAAQDVTDYGAPKPLNLGKFEERLGELADCILIFPESAGSIAELGYLSANAKLRKKLLVVCDTKHQGESFINRGPIKLSNDDSVFTSMIYFDYENPTFNLIKDRIVGRLPRRRTKFDAKPYDELSLHQKFYFCYEIVVIFDPINQDGIDFLFGHYFGDADREEIAFLLSVLISSEYVDRIGATSEYFVARAPDLSFIQFERRSKQRVISDVLNFYQSRAPHVLKEGRDAMSSGDDT